MSTSAGAMPPQVDRQAPGRSTGSWMSRQGRRLRRCAPPLAVWLAAGLLLLMTMAWAVLTPGTRAPDEVQHVNSILRLAEGGGWPEPGDGRMEREVLDMRDLSGATHDGERTFLPGSVNRTPDGQLWTSLSPTGVNDRESLAELDQGGPPTDQLDQMTQHPPGYYAVTAVVFKAVGAENWRYDRALFFLRFLTGLTIAASLPFALWSATRDLTRREPLAAAAAFLPLLIPQLGFIGGAVTNDGLAIAAAAVLTAVLVRVMTAGPSTRRFLAVAVAAGATFWTKGTALTLIPAVPVAIAVAHYRFADRKPKAFLWRWVRDSALVLGAAFVLGGWWWALNLLRYGRVQPSAYEAPTLEDAPVLSLGGFSEVFGRRVSASFFGDIGLLEAPMPVALTRTLTVGFLVLMAIGLWSRRRVGERVVFFLDFALTLGVLFATTYAGHRITHNLPGLQGRYLFVALVPILVLVAIGLDRVARLVRLPSRSLLVLVPLAGGAVSAAGLLIGFRKYYLPTDSSIGHAFDLFLGWVAWSWMPLGLLVAAAAGLFLALAYTVGRTSAAGYAPTEAGPDAGSGWADDGDAPRDPWDESGHDEAGRREQSAGDSSGRSEGWPTAEGDADRAAPEGRQPAVR